jgi:ribonuclease BN (tRNA processing enzyme)
VRLTVVGCAGSTSAAHRAASCYLVEAPHEGRTFRVVLDMGFGAFGELEARMDVFDIDAVLLSHLHADHCIDLAAYYVRLKYDPGSPRRRVDVYGPSDTAGRLARAYDLPERPGMSEQFRFERWQPARPVPLGPFTVTVAPMTHPVETYAISVEHQGRRLVYSGDTGPCADLVELARGAQLMLCEASFAEAPDNPPALHLTGRQAAEHAARAGAEKLVLTHVPPWQDQQQILEEARPAFAGALELAVPGAAYEV